MANLQFVKANKKYLHHFSKMINKLEDEHCVAKYLEIENIKNDIKNFVDKVILLKEKTKFDKKFPHLKHLARNDEFWLVDLDGEIDEVIMRLNFRFPINEELINTYGHVGYFTNPSFRNCGFAQQAIEFVLDYARTNFNLDKIIISALEDNIISQNVIKKFNYKFLNTFLDSYNNKIVRYEIKTLSKLPLIDLHAHPFKEYYENPFLEVENNFENGINKMFIVGTSWEEIEEIKLLNKKYQNVYSVVGIHPNNVNHKENYYDLEKFIDKNVVAIGEIGLDYFYDNGQNKEIQIKAFKIQIELAKKYNLPIILHVRDAYNDIYEIIKLPEYKNLKFIFHTYSGGLMWVDKLLELQNVYFSFSGVITYKKNQEIRKVIEKIPTNLIFTETDAPYLTPEPFRGQINHANYVKYTLLLIARIKKISPIKMAQIIQGNVKKVFGV